MLCAPADRGDNEAFELFDGDALVSYSFDDSEDREHTVRTNESDCDQEADKPPDEIDAEREFVFFDDDYDDRTEGKDEDGSEDDG